MRLIVYQIIFEFWPLISIILLYLFNFLSTLHLISLFLLYCIYARLTSSTSLRYNKSNSTLSFLLSKCPELTSPTYKPHFFLSNNILQLISINHTSNYLYPKQYTEQIEREQIGKTGISLIHYSYIEIEPDNTLPIVVLFPGLTGDHTDMYAKNISHELLMNKYKIIVYQMRMLNNKMTFDTTDEKFSLVEDVNTAMNYLIEKYPQKKFITIGCSYGANQLVNYLGTYPESKNHVIGALSLSNPYDMLICSKFVNGTIYDTFLLYLIRKNFIKNFSDINSKLTKYKINTEAVLSTEISHTFDLEFTSKIMGYIGTDSYYRGISCSKVIQNIQIPVLYVHAMDDRITTPNAIPYDDIDANENSILLTLERGTHLAYVEKGEGLFELRQWLPKPVGQFINALTELEKKKCK